MLHFNNEMLFLSTEWLTNYYVDDSVANHVTDNMVGLRWFVNYDTS